MTKCQDISKIYKSIGLVRIILFNTQLTPLLGMVGKSFYLKKEFQTLSFMS